jgi:hypothetical protein
VSHACTTLLAHLFLSLLLCTHTLDLRDECPSCDHLLVILFKVDACVVEGLVTWVHSPGAMCVTTHAVCTAIHRSSASSL